MTPFERYFGLAKSDQSKVSDLFGVHEDAMELLGHIRIIIEDARDGTNWFSTNLAERLSDGGIGVHLAEEHWRKAYRQCLEIEHDFMRSASDVFTIAGTTACSAHALTFRLAIRLYAVIEDGCRGRISNPDEYLDHALDFPVFGSFPSRSSGVGGKSSTIIQSRSLLMEMIRTLEFAPLPPKTREEYRERYFAALRSKPSDTEVRELYNNLLDNMRVGGEAVTNLVDSRAPEIRSWVVDFYPVGLGELARLVSLLEREVTLAAEERLRLDAPGRTQTQPPCPAAFLGRGRFRIRGTQYSLEEAEASVLQALVELGSATKSKLVKQSGVQDPGRVLKRIREKYEGAFAQFIVLPERRGTGGYRTTIENHADRAQPASELHQ